MRTIRPATRKPPGQSDISERIDESFHISSRSGQRELLQSSSGNSGGSKVSQERFNDAVISPSTTQGQENTQSLTDTSIQSSHIQGSNTKTNTQNRRQKFLSAQPQCGNAESSNAYERSKPKLSIGQLQRTVSDLTPNIHDDQYNSPVITVSSDSDLSSNGELVNMLSDRSGERSGSESGGTPSGSTSSFDSIPAFSAESSTISTASLNSTSSDSSTSNGMFDLSSNTVLNNSIQPGITNNFHSFLVHSDSQYSTSTNDSQDAILETTQKTEQKVVNRIASAFFCLTRNIVRIVGLTCEYVLWIMSLFWKLILQALTSAYAIFNKIIRFWVYKRQTSTRIRIIVSVLLLSLAALFYIPTFRAYVWRNTNRAVCHLQDRFAIQIPLMTLGNNCTGDSDSVSQAIITAVTKQMNIRNEDDLKGNRLRAIVRALVAAEVRTHFIDSNDRIHGGNSFGSFYLDSSDRQRDMIASIIKEETRAAIKERLQLFSDDIVGRTDYALRSAGAKIIGQLTSRTYIQYPDSWWEKQVAYWSNYGTLQGKPPVTAIMPSVHVGQCWPFTGHKGQVGILLSQPIYPTAVTYDHASKRTALDLSPAPKEFEVWGFVGYRDNCTPRDHHERHLDIVDFELRNNFADEAYVDPNDPIIKNIIGSGTFKLGSSPTQVFLGKFVYDINGRSVQTFELPERLNRPIIAVLLKVNSNWGNPRYTCIYRIRVHGNAEHEDNLRIA
ncbi:1013_t:CDS:2 [Paraglomus occultum]|uniref:1013_t:CDS:1 n=1 Tax=Paraglomus occultum TaxID=144539 RepID=A0A9N8YWA7_9GLOM|nr:1013_t:CDS:2 [Paraglomus occultum]